jgi:hypothetical protein
MVHNLTNVISFSY